MVLLKEQAVIGIPIFSLYNCSKFELLIWQIHENKRKLDLFFSWIF